jgi:crotonobetainyl-CoA:carnitine CoA-transferase CaiB-like acyl-CoA transferase
MSTGPLRGLKVLDIATILAAPSCATLLADYGAEVVKLELPGVGDGARDFPPFKDGKSLWWKAINRNKQFITLDVRLPEGLALFKRLIADFDVLVENFRPGTLERWGLSREVLWELQPRLVILRATGFGQTGPYRDRPGFARVFEAMGGLTYLTGEADGEPMHSGYPLGDAIGGLFGAIGVLAALFRRVADPQAPGEEIDLSLTEATFRLLDFLPIEYDQLGSVRGRSGNANQYSAPSAVYCSQDGHFVSLSGSTNAVFAANARAIGRPELPACPRFATNALRVVNAAEINQVFSQWMAQHSLEEILAAFEREQGTIAPILSIAQIFDDPHMRARQAIVEVPDSDFGTVRLHGVVPRFTRDPGEVKSSAGALGEHNHAFYVTRLGLSEAELQRLQEQAVV